MNTQDIIRLKGLLSKLSAAAEKAAREDGSFRKYHSQSIDALNSMQDHLKHLEQGLLTAKMIQPQPSSLTESVGNRTRMAS